MCTVLGIDVGKKELVMSLSEQGKISHRTFRNHADDFAAITHWLNKHKVEQLHVCLEATGRLWEAVAEYLHAAGHVVSVVNPARIHAYGKSLLRRNKTDKLDADLIAHFCANQQPDAWTPLPAAQREVRDLVRLLDDLQGIKTQQTNRLKSGVESAFVLDVLNQHIQQVKEQIAAILRQLKQVIAQDVQLAEDFALLITIPGIGELTAARFLAENLGGFRSVRAVTAHAGLNPQSFTSGSSVNRPPRLSKIGSASLRKTLFFPALTALRHNPLVKALGDRLKERGKKRMVIVGAAMRKLLAIAFGVLKSRRPFDPNYVANLQVVNV